MDMYTHAKAVRDTARGIIAKIGYPMASDSPDIDELQKIAIARGHPCGTKPYLNEVTLTAVVKKGIDEYFKHGEDGDDGGEFEFLKGGITLFVATVEQVRTVDPSVICIASLSAVPTSPEDIRVSFTLHQFLPTPVRSIVDEFGKDEDE